MSMDELQIGAGTPKELIGMGDESLAALRAGTSQQTGAPAVLQPPVEGVDFNIPLSDTQKLNLTGIRLRRSNVQKQIAELQTQDAKLESFFHAELMKTAIANKIDMNKFVLDDNLNVKPMPPHAPPAPFGLRR